MRYLLTISATAAAIPGPVAEWYGKNATSTTLVDSSGNAYPLTGTQTINAGAGPNGEATWTPGAIASRADVCGLAAGAGRCYVAVVRTTNAAARQWLLNQGQSGSGNLYASLAAGESAGYWGSYTVLTSATTAVATDTTAWHILQLAYDAFSGPTAGAVHYYVDGVLSALSPALPATFPDFSAANYTAVGAIPVYGLLWQGPIAYSAIYPTLDSTQVAALYTQLKTYFNL